MTRLAAINLNLLVGLDALLRERSVTQAARAIGVSQPAMSKSLRQLRDMFADPLLVRGGDGLVLTPRAARLQAPLSRTLEQLTRVVEDSFTFDPAQSERIFRIAMPDYLHALLGAHIVDALTARAPRAAVVLLRDDRTSYESLLERGDVDMFVHACLEPPAGLLSEPLVRDRFASAVRADHPAVTGDSMTLETYAALPHCLIMISDDISPGSVDLALEEHGLTRHVACRVRSFLAAPYIVSKSDAVLTGPERLLRIYEAALGLRVLPVPIALHHFTYAATWHERFDADPGSRWLREVVAAAAAQHPDDDVAGPDWYEAWGTRDSPRRRGLVRASGTAPI